MRDEKDRHAADSRRPESPTERETLTLAERACDAQWPRRVPGRLDDRWESAYDAVRARMAARSHCIPVVQRGTAVKK